MLRNLILLAVLVLEADCEDRCGDCTAILTKEKADFGTTVTGKELLDALGKVCSLQPPQECDNFIKERKLIELLYIVCELQPSQTCSILGLCPSAVVDSVQVDECSTCMTVIDYVESHAKGNQTQEAIEKVLDEVCYFVPESLSEKCTTLVNTNGPMIIQLILTETTRQEICEAIHMCTSPVAVVPKKPDRRP